MAHTEAGVLATRLPCLSSLAEKQGALHREVWENGWWQVLAAGQVIRGTV